MGKIIKHKFIWIWAIFQTAFSLSLSPLFSSLSFNPNLFGAQLLSVLRSQFGEKSNGLALNRFLVAEGESKWRRIHSRITSFRIRWRRHHIYIWQTYSNGISVEFFFSFVLFCFVFFFGLSKNRWSLFSVQFNCSLLMRMDGFLWWIFLVSFAIILFNVQWQCIKFLLWKVNDEWANICQSLVDRIVYNFYCQNGFGGCDWCLSPMHYFCINVDWPQYWCGTFDVCMYRISRECISYYGLIRLSFFLTFSEFK